MNIKTLNVFETMTLPVPTALASLAKGKTLTIDCTGRTSLYCLSGALWATVEGNPQDVLAIAGETKAIDGKGKLVISALENARFWLG